MTPRRALGLSLVAMGLLTWAAAACSAPSAPAPTTVAKQETSATKAPEPTKAVATQAPPTVAPTAAPASKVEFPTKGKAISIIVGANAGGPNDVAARLLAPLMEQDLGTPVQVVNKPGAGWQVGLTEMAKSKPDGYTLGYTPLPQTIAIYLDPERKAVFGRKDIQPLAMHVVDPGVIAVKADSPYKTMKELIDAAKANPEKIKASTTGILSDDHLAMLQLQRLTGAKFAFVHFEGAAPSMTAVLGGHVDVYVGNVGDALAQAKTGEIRVLGIMDKEESKYYPGVKTMEEQGIKLYSSSSRGVAMPAGAPKEIIDILSASMKKAISDPEHQKKMDELGFPVKYMGPNEMAAYWDEMETQVKPLMELAR